MNCTKNWHEVYHTMEHPVHYIFVQNLYRFFIIGVGSQSTFKLGGHQIFARKICIKNEQNARILHDSSPKNARILCIIARKIFFPNFRGHVSPLPPPVSYAYVFHYSVNVVGPQSSKPGKSQARPACHFLPFQNLYSPEKLVAEILN